jgi:GNAT superfamily N-acetyltransferase
MGGVRRLGEAGRLDAARSLGDAFADDPVFCWIGGFTDDATRTTRLMGVAIDARFRRGNPLVYTTDGHEAAAIWDPPGAPGVTTRELMRSIVPIVRSVGTGVGRMKQLIDATEARHPVEPHYYLFAIGVRRDVQGGGLGSSLMQPMLKRCDEEGVGAYLENSKARNEAFYVRHGFEPLEPLAVPDGCPKITPMWRRPR